MSEVKLVPDPYPNEPDGWYVVEIHEQDEYYEEKEDYIGLQVRVNPRDPPYLQNWPELKGGPWWGGVIWFVDPPDPPGPYGEGQYDYMYAFKLSPEKP